MTQVERYKTKADRCAAEVAAADREAQVLRGRLSLTIHTVGSNKFEATIFGQMVSFECDTPEMTKKEALALGMWLVEMLKESEP